MIVDEVIKLASQRFYQNSELRLETDFCIDAINECIEIISAICINHNSDVGVEFITRNITKDNSQVTIEGLRTVKYVLDLTNKTYLDRINISLGKLLENENDETKYYYILGNVVYIVPACDISIEIGYWKDKRVNSYANVIPFNGLFDYVIVNYVVMKAKARDDENVNFEKFLTDSITTNVENIILNRKEIVEELPLPFET